MIPSFLPIWFMLLTTAGFRAVENTMVRVGRRYVLNHAFLKSLLMGTIITLTISLTLTLASCTFAILSPSLMDEFQAKLIRICAGYGFQTDHELLIIGVSAILAAGFIAAPLFAPVARRLLRTAV